MTIATSNSSWTCPSCGAEASGKFCSSCGAGMSPGPAGPLGLLTSEIKGQGVGGFVSTLFRLLRSPVKNTLSLTDDPRYTGHKAFFVTSTAISVTVSSYLATHQPPPPDAPAWYVEFMASLGNWYPFLLTAFNYISVFGGFLIGYWIFRRFAHQKRTPQEYFKFTCLTAGFGALIGAALSGASDLLTANQFGLISGESMAIGLSVLVVALALFIIYYGVRCQKRFWQLSVGGLIVSNILMFMVIVLIFAAIGAIAYVVAVGLIA